MRTSRAAARLRESPVMRCPSCGRDSRTVQGVCADCWTPKDGRIPLHAPPPPQRTPFFDFDWDDPFVLAMAATPVLGAIGTVLWKVFA